MENLFELEFEKYWMFPSSYTPERKKTAILDCINSGDYIASLKKDGNMSRFVKFNGEMRLQSRSKSTVTKTFSDKKDWVPHIMQSLAALPDNTILIGELYYPGGNSDTIGTILRCKADKAIYRQQKEYGLVHYYIRDCWYYDGQSLMDRPYSERIKVVAHIYNLYLDTNPEIELAHYCDTPAEIRAEMDYAFQNNEEGLVLVSRDATVAPGKRTAWKTLKVKKELHQEVDCFTTGHYKEATRLYSGKELESWEYWEDLKTGELKLGEYFNDYERGASIEPVTKPFFYGWASSMEIGWYNNAGEIEVIGYVSGISDDIKEGLVTDNAAYRLRPCKVTAMEWTKDGALRHPKFMGFRDDITAEDCQKSKVFEEEGV